MSRSLSFGFPSLSSSSSNFFLLIILPVEDFTIESAPVGLACFPAHCKNLNRSNWRTIHFRHMCITQMKVLCALWFWTLQVCVATFFAQFFFLSVEEPETSLLLALSREGIQFGVVNNNNRKTWLIFNHSSNFWFCKLSAEKELLTQTYATITTIWNHILLEFPFRIHQKQVWGKTDLLLLVQRKILDQELAQNWMVLEHLQEQLEVEAKEKQ